MKKLLTGLLLLSSISLLATESAVENDLECSFKEEGKEFAARTVYANSHSRAIQGFFVIENEYLLYRLERGEHGELGLRVKYAGEAFNDFFSFDDGTNISFKGEIKDINVSFECNGTWNI